MKNEYYILDSAAPNREPVKNKTTALSEPEKKGFITRIKNALLSVWRNNIEHELNELM